MPLFDIELNRLADNVGEADLVIRLHTAAPSNASPTNGRVTTGGGLYVSGATLAAADISTSSDGDIENNVDILFGIATADVGTVTHWSAYRGAAPVAFRSLPSTTVVNTDTYQINANSMQFNGSTT